MALHNLVINLRKQKNGLERQRLLLHWGLLAWGELYMNQTTSACFHIQPLWSRKVVVTLSLIELVLWTFIKLTPKMGHTQNFLHGWKNISLRSHHRLQFISNIKVGPIPHCGKIEIISMADFHKRNVRVFNLQVIVAWLLDLKNVTPKQKHNI